MGNKGRNWKKQMQGNTEKKEHRISKSEQLRIEQSPDDIKGETGQDHSRIQKHRVRNGDQNYTSAANLTIATWDQIMG